MRLLWLLLTVPLEAAYLAALNYHQQGLLMAAAKYLLTSFFSLLVGAYTDCAARMHFRAG